MEYKTLPSFIKTVDVDTRTIVGVFAVHGNIDSYADISHPGSFNKTITERGNRVKFLWNHDFLGGPPIAKVLNIREIGRDELPSQVLERAPDATGGVEVTRQYMKTGRAAEVFEAVAEGASDEMSYGYDALQFDFSEVNGTKVRNIREVRLWEVSDVIFGANPATAGSKLHLPDDVLLKHLQARLDELKAGNRHSSADYDLIDQIAAAAAQLGARNIKLIDADDTKSVDIPATDESRAERHEPISLTLEKARLFFLENA
jgi:hypothetical protein